METSQVILEFFTQCYLDQSYSSRGGSKQFPKKTWDVQNLLALLNQD